MRRTSGPKSSAPARAARQEREAAWARGDYRALVLWARRPADPAAVDEGRQADLARVAALSMEPTVVALGMGSTLLYAAAWVWALSAGG